MTLLLTAGLVLARVLGLIISMPVLNSTSIPNMVKAVLAIMLTVLLAPVVEPTQSDLGLRLLLGSMTGELMLGILMGGSLTLVFSSMSIMSGIISSQIGQAASMQFNPTLSGMSTPVGNISIYLALTVFLGTNLHLVLLTILAESFKEVPVDTMLVPLNGPQLWLSLSEGIFMISLKMSVPIMMLVLLINSFIAILAKVAQSMNMFFSVGFMLTMFVGMLLFTFVFPNILVLNQEQMEETLRRIPELFDMIGSSNG